MTLSVCECEKDNLQISHLLIYESPGSSQEVRISLYSL